MNHDKQLMYIEPMQDHYAKKFFKGYNVSLRKSVESMDRKFTHFTLLPEDKQRNLGGYDYNLTKDDNEMLDNIHPHHIYHSHLFKNTKLKDNLLGFLTKQRESNDTIKNVLLKNQTPEETANDRYYVKPADKKNL